MTKLSVFTEAEAYCPYTNIRWSHKNSGDVGVFVIIIRITELQVDSLIDGN
jgi:hypothetical protein